MLCGVPRTGIHSIRLFDFAVVDVMLSLLLAALLTYFKGWSLWLTVPSVLVVGIIAHRLLKIDTKLNTMIFGALQTP